MKLDEEMNKIIEDDLTNEDKIKRRIKAPNLVHAIMKKFREDYHSPVGKPIKLIGQLTKRRNGYFIILPPRELRGIDSTIETFLEVPIKLPEANKLTEGTITKFEGTMRPLVDRHVIPKRGQRVTTTKYFEVSDWDYDYRELYKEINPIPLSEIRKMIVEKFDTVKFHDKALILSAISAPTLCNTMGGVSSLISSPDLPKNDFSYLKKFLLSLVPSWHQKPTQGGFQYHQYSGLSQKLRKVLRERKNSQLEFSPLVSHEGKINPDHDFTFFELDDPLVLRESSISINQDNKEFEEFKYEIQWSILGAHASLQQIDESNIPVTFNQKFDEWNQKMFQNSDLYPKLEANAKYVTSGIKGRKGGILRLAGALARIQEKPLDMTNIKEAFTTTTALFHDFEIAYGHYFDHFVIDKQSRYHGKPKWKRMEDFKIKIFSILQMNGEKGITLNQVLEEAEKLNVPEKRALTFMDELYRSGEIYKVEDRIIKV